MTIRSYELPVDGDVLKGTAWLPEKPVACMLVEHGMADHHQRFAEFAASLTERGLAVYSYDKRGHGTTAGQPGTPEWEKKSGWFAAKDGWKVVTGDSLAVLAFIRSGGVTSAADGKLPLFLFGHSMGSFVARTVAADPRCAELKLAGLVLSGTAGNPGGLGVAGKIMAGLICAFRGPFKPSPFLDKLASGPYAKQACKGAEPRTVFDWISSDPAVVDTYMADPYCGFVMATSFYRDIVDGLRGLFTADYAARFPRDLPVLMFSGEDDPVGGMSAGVRAVHDAYRAWGVKDLSLTLYPGRRHEMLNEPNRAEVYRLVGEWVQARLPQ